MFDPLISEWFTRRFAAPTEPQALGWPEIRSGRDVLISAPTGSGKTLAAFLICLDRLLRLARAASLSDRTEVVYVSPLKALSNDIQKNLEAPLAEIAELAAQKGITLPRIRTAVRTGDTPVWERQQMPKQPPHILVTTPESLFILLTAEKSRRMLRTTGTVIVDEIHAVAGDKRGSHLALSLARLDDLVERSGGARPQRIGLSATVHPIEEVAAFLSESARIINVGHRREMDLAVEVPRDELGPVASNAMWSEIYDRIAELIRAHRTTLVFVNTRRLSERVAHHLVQRLGEKAVLPHHGSLSRSLRLTAERLLKSGELRAVVATASLELGIDIGSVELVCQIGSPRSIVVALQRIGRSGHWIGALPKGRLFATSRDELIDCAALVRALRAGELDRLRIPQAPLDVLAQQIVAAAACEEWSEEDLFALARRSYPYRQLERADFDAIVSILSEGIATSRGRSGAYLHRDRVNGRVRARRGARLAAITSGGAIPDSANYLVVADPEGTTVGTVDEEFATESVSGDVFLLGTTSWRIRRIEPGRVRVENAHGAPPSIPFWRGEAPARTSELSQARGACFSLSTQPPDALEFFMRECGLDRLGAEQAMAYLRAGQAALGASPSNRTVIAERFFDEAGGTQLVLHAPFGARINRAWGLALRRHISESLGFEPQAAATDNGILLSLGEQHGFPLEIVFEFVKADTVERVLSEAVLESPMFTARWRWNASRALAVLRFAGGRKVPLPIQRLRAEDLLEAVFPSQPGHPLVRETMANCLHEAMDLEGLKSVLAAIEAGAIHTIAIDTPAPSPFSHEIVNANPYAYLDDVPLEERRARAVQLRRTLPADMVEGAGALDPEIIAQVGADSWPLVRDPDELHDALLTLITLPPVPEWKEFFSQLVQARRASELCWGDALFWVAAERLDTARAAHAAKDETCAAAILRGWLESSGPARASELAARLALPRALVELALTRLEAEGQVLRGQFTAPAVPGEPEWCNRRILARIHRLTLGKLRHEIEPVAAADFMRYLARWQHVAPGTQLHGLEGALEVIRQLEGYEISAVAWESHVLPRRIARYNPELLDRLCLSGEVMWGRLSPHPAFEDVSEPRPSGRGRRVRPTRLAPVAFFLREGGAGFLPCVPAGLEHVSHVARDVLAALERQGASFFTELLRSTNRLASEVEDGLWELVAAGLVTADGFENLRALIDPKRRRGEGRGRYARPRHAAGRWALMPAATTKDPFLSAETFARLLLRRWGVVLRDLLARESLAPPWRDLLVALRRMEARGEIRGGRFVAGLPGEQFALPEAVQLLRAVRRLEQTPEQVRISPADPLNLLGIILPGPRLSALASGALLLRTGAGLLEPASNPPALSHNLESSSLPRRAAPIDAR